MSCELKHIELKQIKVRSSKGAFKPSQGNSSSDEKKQQQQQQQSAHKSPLVHRSTAHGQRMTKTTVGLLPPHAALP
jgi:hypothetical protein